MIYNEALKISNDNLLPIAKTLYELEGFTFSLITPHEGGRNILYVCRKTDEHDKILRISFLNDRSREHYLGEVEFIRYLAVNGGSVANVYTSANGNLLEEVTCGNQEFFICLFEKARGIMLVENGYRYREGVPLNEYFYNCGKVLGKLHHLAKEYTPVHRRYNIFDKFNAEYIDKLIPESLTLLKQKLLGHINVLKETNQSREAFGMIHFDYNDGNYNIDFETGQITVYDFDNSCFGWYMFDLAGLWAHGVGWTQFEPDAEKRKKFMDDYFNVVIEGYRSETELDDSMLKQLPLFIRTYLMENIVDAFDVMRREGELECDGELSYKIKCMEDDIPYMGLFHEIYSCNEPFELEPRVV